MKHRGLTLIELLATVALLSSIVVAATSWIQIASAAGADALQAARWRNAANAVLALIHDDLVSGDFNSTDPGHRKDRKEPNQQEHEAHCRVIDGALVIATRGAQGIESAHRYRRDPMENRLERITAGASGRSEPEMRRPLLGDVESFNARTTEDTSRLDVTITSSAGVRVTRSYRLP